MSETPIHDWIQPRLRAMVAEAVAAGFDPLTVTAVITDLIASTDFTEGEQPDRAG